MTDQEQPQGYPTYIPPQYDPTFWTPPPVQLPSAQRARHRRVVVGSVAAATVTALAVGAIALNVSAAHNARSDSTVATAPNNQTNPVFPNGQDTSPSIPGDQSGNGASSGTTGTATAAQQVGVVDINTVLDFGSGKAAGTGIVLTSSGEILTNNHVIDGSTSISVTIVSTGAKYTATVVGTDPTDDVAVLQLKNASGLQTAKLGDSSKVAVGDVVTAVGNAGGVGGTPSSATGTVTALGQSITASDSNGSNPEQLTNMIQINAPIQAGDSGGPLYAANGTVVGIDTAANASRRSAATTGFAIPIAKAVGIADQIETGTETSTIHIGYPAFLGVQLSQSGQSATGGAVVGGIVSGSAAASAGLQAGDTITAVNGTAVTTPTGLSKIMQQLEPGQQARITWHDAAGASHTATVTLGTGPAD
jgi:S1-C subfamily serine protease